MVTFATVSTQRLQSHAHNPPKTGTHSTHWVLEAEVVPRRPSHPDRIRTCRRPLSGWCWSWRGGAGGERPPWFDLVGGCEGDEFPLHAVEVQRAAGGDVRDLSWRE